MTLQCMTAVFFSLLYFPALCGSRQLMRDKNKHSFLIYYVLKCALIIHKWCFMRFDFYTSAEVVGILGQRLKQHRLQQNLTQLQLAQRAGTGLSTIARMEAGQGGTLDNVVRVATALGLINGFAGLFDTTPQNIDEALAQQRPRQRASGKQR